MREIKFRVWDKENNVMIAPFELLQYMSFNEGAQERLVPQVTSNIELMQYTGLKDKNGVEIYEGDIVLVQMLGRGTKPDTMTIEYNQAEFIAKYRPDKAYGLSYIFDSNKNVEVIGNIYDNPELLK